MTASNILCKERDLWGGGGGWPVMYNTYLLPLKNPLSPNNWEGGFPETRGDIKEARGLDAILTDSGEECTE